MAVTNLTTAYTALSLSLARCEWWEVVVEQEAHLAAIQHIVHNLLIEFRTQCTGRKRLCLTTGEDSRAVRTWQWTYLAPDRTNLGWHTTIQTLTLIENATTHSIAHHIMVVTIHHGFFLGQLVFCQVGMCSSILLLEVCQNLVECLGTCMLIECLLRDVVSWLIQFLLHLLTQLFVISLVAILALHGRTNFLCQFHLSLAHHLDGFMTSLQCTEQVLLRNLTHFAFHHHDILISGTYHDVHVGILQLLEGWVDDILAIDASYANLRDRTTERYVRNSQCCRSSQASQCVRHIYAIGREEDDVYVNFCMIIVWEQRAKCAVHQTAGQNLIV